MNSIKVSTKEELQSAQKSGLHEIIVVGELANKLKKAKKVSKISKAGLAVLTVTLGGAAIVAPVTGGLSMFAAAPAAALTGVEIAAIISASFLGIGLVIAIFKGYEEIEYSNGRLVLRKKR